MTQPKVPKVEYKWAFAFKSLPPPLYPQYPVPKSAPRNGRCKEWGDKSNLILWTWSKRTKEDGKEPVNSFSLLSSRDPKGFNQEGGREFQQLVSYWLIGSGKNNLQKKPATGTVLYYTSCCIKGFLMGDSHICKLINDSSSFRHSRLDRLSWGIFFSKAALSFSLFSSPSPPFVSWFLFTRLRCTDRPMTVRIQCVPQKNKWSQVLPLFYCFIKILATRKTQRKLIYVYFWTIPF